MNSVDEIRTLLTALCCFSPVKGKLYKSETQALSDHEIAKLVDKPVEEWLKIKPEVLKFVLTLDTNGVMGISDEIAGLLSDLGASFEDDPSIKEKLKAIQGAYKKVLQPHQLFVEYYKRLKKVEQIPDWDKIYYRSHASIASMVIKKIGFETGIRVMEWVNIKYKSWNLKSILGSYQYYWQETRKEIDHERVSAIRNAKEYLE